jgi:hypothetical protein
VGMSDWRAVMVDTFPTAGYLEYEISYSVEGS